MSFRNSFSIAVLGSFALASPLYANSCSNMDVLGTYDQHPYQENEYQIYAVGTFRIMGEQDESKQPMFNLTNITCDKDPSDPRASNLECKVAQASVFANPDAPNTDRPNCSLDLDLSTYTMKELQRGVFSGAGSSGMCYDTILTINKNSQRVFLSFTRSQSSEAIDKTRPGTCGSPPRVQTLMNCTAWPRMRKPGAPPRYCDFSSSSDK